MKPNARLFAIQHHAEQLDNQGVPYVKHLEAVARAVMELRLRGIMLPETNFDMKLGRDQGETYSSTLFVETAWLHDIIEDTDVTEQVLLDEGFDPRVVEAVVAMTKREGQPYQEYLEQVKANPIARLVKLADMRHNMDLTRNLTSNPTDRDIKRTIKYVRGTAFLLREESHE